MEQILDLARWAPSGDNTQVWRFEVVSPFHVAVHCFDTREYCIYDYNGRASQIAMGALLENLKIAASIHGLASDIARRSASTEERPVFDVRFAPSASVGVDPLSAFVTIRSVQRRSLKTRPLSHREKKALEQAAGEKYQVIWLEGWKSRLDMAKLLFHNAKLRLTAPEAYQVHSQVIEWNAHYSEDRVPDHAIGLDPVGTWLMRYAMQSWERVEFFNKYLAGTWLPRIQLDLLPGLFCAAHFILVAKEPPVSIDHYLCAGRQIQRFWLTATQLDLQLQPEITPLIFRAYVRDSRHFSGVSGLFERAAMLTGLLNDLVGSAAADSAVFMGRIGGGQQPKARSLRRPLEELLIKPVQ